MLVYLVGEPVHEAIGTSLAIVGAIAGHGVYVHRSNVRFKYGAVVGVLG